jgi:LPXTG-motif cell wall-anchored protein
MNLVDSWTLIGVATGAACGLVLVLWKKKKSA